MDQLRPDELARQVAAWHNRHPLAQRISAAQVQGMGWVALPFVALPGPAGQGAVPPPVLTEPAEPPGPRRLRDRVRQRLQGAEPAAGAGDAALARPLGLLQRWRAAWQRNSAMRAAFSEDFIAPISPRQAARWAQRHGRLQVLTAGLPLRQVLADPQWARAEAPVLQLHVPTAAVELGARRTRLLLSLDGAVLGPRLFSRARMAAAASPLALVVLALLLPSPAAWFAPFAPREAEQHDQVALAPAAEAPGFESALPDAAVPEPAAVPDGITLPFEAGQTPDQPAAPVWTPDPAPSPEPSQQPEPAAPPASAPAEEAALPPDDPPPEPPAETSAADANKLVRPLSPEAKAAARRALNEARRASGLPPLPDRPSRGPAMAVTSPGGVPPPSTPPPPAAVQAAVAELGPVWALSSRVLRTRAESEQLQAAVRGLLASHTREPMIVELMPVGDDWRVVCWPFLRREDAQLARALLLTRGLRMEPVEF